MISQSHHLGNGAAGVVSKFSTPPPSFFLLQMKVPLPPSSSVCTSCLNYRAALQVFPAAVCPSDLAGFLHGTLCRAIHGPPKIALACRSGVRLHLFKCRVAPLPSMESLWIDTTVTGSRVLTWQTTPPAACIRSETTGPSDSQSGNVLGPCAPISISGPNSSVVQVQGPGQG